MSGSDFFTQDHAERYDDRNKKLAPISDGLHFLTSLMLESLPSQARVLSVGAGTGADIIALARVYPNWSFVALEPSEAMLSVCRKRIEEAGFSDRCEFFHGFANEFPAEENFDAVLAILVGHFVKKSERLGFYQSLVNHLRSGGVLVNAEISCDLNSDQFPLMLRGWESVQKLMGATPEAIAKLPSMLRDPLAVLPPAEVEALLSRAGVSPPLRFFQALMVSGWYGIKSSE